MVVSVGGVRSGRMAMELHKVEAEIKRSGMFCDVLRDKVDEYGEKISGQKQTVKKNIPCLFHTTKGYVKQKDTEGSVIVTKGQPKLMVLFQDVSDIKNGDYVIMNGKRFNIVETNNIQEYNIVADLSMELVLDGIQI